MSENQLVDLAIMLGNDFTAPLLRSKRARDKSFGITIDLDEVDEDDDEFYETRSFAEKITCLLQQNQRWSRGKK